MNKPSDQNQMPPAKSGEQTQPRKGDKDDTREAAPDAGKSSYLPNSGREDKRPMQPARGDDDVMSQKQPQSQP